MQARLIELQLQRGRLLERIAHQRRALADQSQPVAHVLHVGDRLAEVVAQGKVFVLRHPLAVAAVVGALVVLRPAGVWRWSRRGFFAWRTWTAMRAALPAFLSRLL
ncbi:MAG: hypothetical protein H6929_21405 [Rhodoferax sp.]|jgi:hypothetical protein|nr:hypothetical protein [Rhodoferax sp.]MCP5263919.1 hypothetical protein [Rhodoferax sp.]MCW5631275.1 hypothetical protein [Rhodoferax sp.]